MKTEDQPYRLRFSLTARGLNLRLARRSFALRYPAAIWKNYPDSGKKFFLDNLSYLATCAFPLVAPSIEEIEYNTSFPLFYPYFRQLVYRDIPSSVEDYPLDTGDTLKKFHNLKINFADYEVKPPCFNAATDTKRVIVPLSFGKDSMLTLALAKELKLEPVGVYINDTVSGWENAIKVKKAREIEKRFKIKCLVITNNMENINDFEFWNANPSALGYAHMMAGFVFMLLPVAHFFRTGSIILGNQQNMNFSFANKHGWRTFPSYDQTSLGTKQLDNFISLSSSRKVKVISLIEPLTNLAITKILHDRYAEYGKETVSCDALNTVKDKRRWCQECNKCGRLYILMKAWGIDAKNRGFTRELLEKKDEKLYRLFDGKESDNYERSREARDEQLLAFYMAWQKGTKGRIMDKFAEIYLPEARRREKELKKTYLKFYPSLNVPRHLEKNLVAICRRELPFKI